ncbi:hypothetical protein [Leptospira sp. GIMC2001]|uniref:hypothetical protein n=1 Tax=Leptospira sp. GIMC2001 TaxID=1513297 RepID=UPI00234A8BDB|nr:hypothetical protein [Leptospira sp. GIMC2001]WCL49518.1 hypothetical protein O4O04_19870 [Leptospira sp. GIMC2001]
MMKTFICITTLLFSLNSLSAYTPAKWSYTDRLILNPKDQKHKPKQEEVYDENNKLLLTSKLIYNSEFLQSEEFFRDGKSEGRTMYSYDSKGRLSKEVTYDSSNKITESKEFFYNSKGNLSTIKIFDTDGKLIQICVINSMDREMIQSGEITWQDTKDKEKLSLTGSKTSKVLTVMDEKKKPIARVEISLNAKGDVTERLFIQNNSFRKNLFDYDSEGKLIGFSFHVKQDGKWQLVKTHKLIY